MTDATVALLLAAMLGALALLTLIGALLLSRRLARIGDTLRQADMRLVAEVPELANRFVTGRHQLNEADAAIERALWFLSRLDHRLDAMRETMRARRDELDRGRSRMIAARAAAGRYRRRAQMLIRAIELRRAILG